MEGLLYKRELKRIKKVKYERKDGSIKVYEYPEAIKPIPDVITEDEIDDFGDHYVQPYRCIFYLTYLTGGRISEVIEIRKRDIKETKDNGQSILIIKLNTRKNRFSKFRNIPIPYSPMVEKVKTYISDLERNNEDFIFRELARIKRGRTKVWEQFSKEIVTIRAVRGTEYIKEYEMKMRPHYLRHCRATHLAEKYGFDSLYLMYFMGWTSPAPAKRYAHLNWKSMINKMMQNR